MSQAIDSGLVRRGGLPVLALAGLVLVSGCGADSSPSSAAGPGTPTTAPTTDAATGAATDAATQAATDAGTATDAATGAATATDAATGADVPVLTGVVGTEEDPDAFVIGLSDDAGNPVTTLEAGTYRIQVQDPSEIHNFHLIGGEVDETTTVPEVTETTFEVTLTAGDYTYVCDPHPRMVGSFTVT